MKYRRHYKLFDLQHRSRSNTPQRLPTTSIVKDNIGRAILFLVLGLDNLIARQVSAMRTQPVTLRFCFKSHAAPMKPLVRTLLVVAGHHVPVRDLLTDAVDLVAFGILLGLIDVVIGTC